MEPFLCFSHKGIVKIAVQQKVHMYRLRGNSLKVVAVYSFLVAQEDVFQSLLCFKGPAPAQGFWYRGGGVTVLPFISIDHAHGMFM